MEILSSSQGQLPGVITVTAVGSCSVAAMGQCDKWGAAGGDSHEGQE